MILSVQFVQYIIITTLIVFLFPFKLPQELSEEWKHTLPPSTLPL